MQPMYEVIGYYSCDGKRLYTKEKSGYGYMFFEDGTQYMGGRSFNPTGGNCILCGQTVGDYYWAVKHDDGRIICMDHYTTTESQDMAAYGVYPKHHTAGFKYYTDG